MNKAALAWLALLLVFMGSTVLYLGWKMSRIPDSGVAEYEVDTEYRKVPPSNGEPFLTDFELTERSGKIVSSEELDGRVYVTNFFFSSCPGTCLQQNKKVQEIQREFGKQGVQFVSITCDPEIDTPTRLREYASKLEADEKEWWFATGDLAYIRRVAGEIYSIPLDKQTHAERFFVTDKWGNRRGQFEWNKLDKITEMKSTLSKLLNETEPPAEFQNKQPATVSPDVTAYRPPAAEQPATETPDEKQDESASSEALSESSKSEEATELATP